MIETRATGIVCSDSCAPKRTTHASRAYPTDGKADIPYPYADALTTTTNDVKTLVPQAAGVGKL